MPGWLFGGGSEKRRQRRNGGFFRSGAREGAGLVVQEGAALEVGTEFHGLAVIGGQGYGLIGDVLGFTAALAQDGRIRVARGLFRSRHSFIAPGIVC